MEQSELTEKLRAITDRFHVGHHTGTLAGLIAPFDVSKPNEHDNKQDFLVEMNAVRNGMANVEGLIDFLAAGYRNGPVPVDVGERIAKFVDGDARRQSPDYTVETGFDLVRKNASEMGLTQCLIYQLLDFQRGLRKRYVDLRDQEKEFWSGNSRPPNHYARTIALRFARFVASNTQKKPTFGTSRDGGHPSTDFGRALEELFELLEIKANVRNAAQWAISQLTEDDTKTAVNAMGALYGFGAIRPEERLARLLEKDIGP